MQISKQKLNSTIAKQIEDIFYQLISDTRTPQESKELLSDLLSKTEQQAVFKRLAIALFLDKNRSYENIKHYLKVSSATIASVHQSLGNPGFQLAIQKVKADKHATGWMHVVSTLVEKILATKKSDL